MPGLLVSLKDTVARDLGSPAVGNAFRQIENWANATTWKHLVYTANFADFGGGFVGVQWCQDPLGWFHLRGLAHYTGTVASGGAVTVGTIPTGSTSTAIIGWGNADYGAFPAVIGRVQVQGNGVVTWTNLNSVNAVNPYVACWLPPFTVF